MLRSRKISIIISTFLLLAFLQGTFYPTISYALTNGYHQPEYTSYEQIDATDMVNLATGDFSYNIPLLYVPSPEGGFSLPLSYHAGIRNEQEASWVGLGWNINAGAIARNVNGYPDDYSGGQGLVTINDPGGSGRVNNYILWQTYFENGRSTGGTIGIGSTLSFGWGSHAGPRGFSVLGININRDGVKVDPVGLGMSVAQIGLIVATAGAGTPAATAMGIAANAASTYAMVSTTLQNTTGATNINDWRFVQSNNFWTYKYRWYLHKTSLPKRYGALYLGIMDQDPENVDNLLRVYDDNGLKDNYLYNDYYASPSCTNSNECAMTGPSSDMYTTSGDLAKSIAPTHIAYDYYNVMGNGISGNIQPYRLDIGTFAGGIPGDNDRRFNLVDFIEYKVPFRYPADISNKYSHHIGQSNNSSSEMFNT